MEQQRLSGKIRVIYFENLTLKIDIKSKIFNPLQIIKSINGYVANGLRG